MVPFRTCLTPPTTLFIFRVGAALYVHQNKTSSLIHANRGIKLSFSSEKLCHQLSVTFGEGESLHFGPMNLLALN